MKKLYALPLAALALMAACEDGSKGLLEPTMPEIGGPNFHHQGSITTSTFSVTANSPAAGEATVRWGATDNQRHVEFFSIELWEDGATAASKTYRTQDGSARSFVIPAADLAAGKKYKVRVSGRNISHGTSSTQQLENNNTYYWTDFSTTFCLSSCTVAKESQGTVTFTGMQTRVYGAQFSVTAVAESHLQLTLEASGACTVGSPTYNATTGVTSATVTATSVGSCGIKASNDGNSQYDPIVAQDAFTINARPIQVQATVSASSIVYGNTAPTLGYTLNGTFVDGDGAQAAFENAMAVGFSGTPNAAGFLDAGSYTVTPSWTGFSNSNYDVHLANPGTAGFAVTARPITVQANSSPSSIVYGSPAPRFGYTLTGSFVSGDEAQAAFEAVVRVTSNAIANTDGFVNVGSYTVTPSWTGFSNSNYNIQLANPGTAGFAVTARPITVTADAKSKFYGDSDPALTWALTSGTLVGNDQITGALTREAGESVGEHNILVGTLTAGSNYTLTFNGAKLTIAPWANKGFYSPVSMTQSGGPTVYNTAKAGSTIPLKFNVFSGTVEQISTAAVEGLSAQKVACTAGVSDAVDVLSSGGTSLRYSGTPGVDGQFIQNWKTPTTGGCYRAIVTTKDGSKIEAFFNLK